jgi:hypothetical protein
MVSFDAFTIFNSFIFVSLLSVIIAILKYGMDYFHQINNVMFEKFSETNDEDKLYQYYINYSYKKETKSLIIENSKKIKKLSKIIKHILDKEAHLEYEKRSEGLQCSTCFSKIIRKDDNGDDLLKEVERNIKFISCSEFNKLY